jgi:hypothetical protein
MEFEQVTAGVRSGRDHDCAVHCAVAPQGDNADRSQGRVYAKESHGQVPCVALVASGRSVKGYVAAWVNELWSGLQVDGAGLARDGHADRALLTPDQHASHQRHADSPPGNSHTARIVGLHSPSGT